MGDEVDPVVIYLCGLVFWLSPHATACLWSQKPSIVLQPVGTKAKVLSKPRFRGQAGVFTQAGWPR